ncbi:MAG: cytochrome c-type biogenesis protein [Sinimarinibacterium flocculans]|uniref:cytochrome c-type biogenesis protein n=1 Tax=Sinimarinibacterium flocculans TaxID=985250 RepID=UPI003C32BAD9
MRHPTVKAAVLSAALLAAGALVPAHAQSDGLSAAQAERYQALVTELRCLVCQNQSIADSNAPLAADLREQVREQILAGRSDAQIHDYVTERYGDFVLYRPPFKPSTWLLWFGPFLLLAAALAVALRFAKRRATPQTPPPVDRERLQRLLEDTRQ